MKQVIAATILMLTFPATAWAQEGTKAQDLYDHCVKNDAICGPFLMGVAGAMVMLGKAYEDKTLEREFVAALDVFAICSRGAPVTGNILRHVYIAWLDRHPEDTL